MTIFKTVALSTTVICASLFFGDVNAIPVPIVDGNGNPVMQNGVQVMLQDDAAPLPSKNNGSSVYYLNGRTMMQVNKNTNINDSLYFCINQNQYVKIDYLENNAIRDRHRQRIHNPAQQLCNHLDNITLCAKLHIDDWSKDIAKLRENGLFNDRKKIIDMSFKYLQQTSADGGKALICSIKEGLKSHQAILNQEIIDRYMTLRICFSQNRAYGNAGKVIDYLILNAAPGMYPEEIDIINEIHTYLVCHIAKHFCHHTIMGTPVAKFRSAGIHAPQEASPYTSMSYNIARVQPSYDQAKIIARDVYPNIVQYLYDTYDFKFDIDNDRFTIRLATGKSKPSVYSSKQLIDMAKLNISKLQEISKYNDTSPDIYNIQTYMVGQQVAQKLTNNFFYLFFNIGVNLNANQFFRNGGIDGSIFTVAIK